MERIYNWLATSSFVQKTGIMALICGGIVGYYYLVPYAAVKEKIKKFENKVKYARISLGSSKKRLTKTRSARKELQEIEKKGKSLSTRIPSSVDMSQLVGELDEMADEINIRKIKPVDEEQSIGTEVKIKPIGFELTGRFHPVCRFLYKMFQMDRLMDVGDISLFLIEKKSGRIKEMEKKHQLKASFTARIYYSPTIVEVENSKDKRKR
ncbi:MAG: type 4a pilus biogenesis protein PilO [Myxococcota bacterium]